MHENDFDFERYKRLDFSHARPLRENPKFKKFQDNVKAMQLQEQDKFLSQFDSDVREVVIRHNTVPKNLPKPTQRQI